MDSTYASEFDKILEKSYPSWAKRHISIPSVSVYSILESSASKHSSKVAINFMGKKISFGELKVQVEGAATFLNQLGVKKGDRVSLMLPNIPQFVIMFFAILRLGAIVVQTNPIYTKHELEYQLSDAGAEVVIVLDDFADKVHGLYPNIVKKIVVVKVEDYLPGLLASLYSLQRSMKKTKPVVPKGSHVSFFNGKTRPGELPSIEFNPDEQVALLQYTGGTTGVPKGAILTHKNLVSNIYQVNEWLPEKFRSNLSYLAAIPFFHVYGMMTAMLGPIFQGSTMYLVPDPRDIKRVVGSIKRNKPDAFPGVPAMYHAVINYPHIEKYNVQSIQVCLSGAAPLPDELQKKFSAISGSRLTEGYGLSETSPVANVNIIGGEKEGNGGPRLGSVGVAIPETYEKIVDVETGTKELPRGEIGELIISGPQVMKGYWKNPAETSKVLIDGWLHTGDLARMDDDGYVYIVDRKKDLIIASGYNIYPREVEEVLFKHPAVSDAAVVGAKDEYRGETIKAFLVLKGGEKVTPEEITEFCRGYLAPYKIPRIVEFRETLPKTMVGKVLRRELQ
ncbi:MAG: long-chain fatty acid--CoA ligase [Candidatus Thermoplasmatota archaeon]|nr:long-chain fatty acid--CoA ligase [Candidatus Thermoplasmatota archaeon]MCL5437616.1 long-chain fatty acid--CoA ligase [Candidatus Thermoplasmatota archaeon]